MDPVLGAAAPSERWRRRETLDGASPNRLRFAPVGWREVNPDPNSRENMDVRHRALRSALRPETRSRLEIIVAECAGKRVLDLGCVDHEARQSGRAEWLHGHVASAASYCLGVDADEVGVKELVGAGYNMVVADFTGDLGEVERHGPFDVVVAGEVIEHVADQQALIVNARHVLQPGGRLVVTTPNPYAPWRFMAGVRCETWENVDHVVYAFPSGMAELADRCDMRLVSWSTIDDTRRGDLRLAARLLVTRTVKRKPFPIGYVNPLVLGLLRRHSCLGTAGETAIYVLERPDAAPGGVGQDPQLT